MMLRSFATREKEVSKDLVGINRDKVKALQTAEREKMAKKWRKGKSSSGRTYDVTTKLSICEFTYQQ